MRNNQKAANVYLAKISFRIIWIACVAFLLFLSFMLYNNYRSSRESYLTSIDTAFKERLLALDNEIFDTAAYIINLHSIAEVSLNSDFTDKDLEPFYDLLDSNFRYHPDSELLYMFDAPLVNGTLLDSTVYLRGPAYKYRYLSGRAIKTAYSMIALQKANSINNKNVILSYLYTQEPRFSVIYPFVDIEMRLANSGAKVQDIYPTSFEYANEQFDTLGTKEYFWTKPYFDFTGKGMMVSCAKPIMYKGMVNGIVGADVTLDYLNKHLIPLNSIDGKMYLVSDYGQVIGGSGIAYEKEEDLLNAEELFVNFPEELETLRGHLNSAPWELYYFFSNDEVINRFSQTILNSITIVMVFILIAGAGIYQIRAQVILPAAKAELEIESLNKKLEYKIELRTAELQSRELLLSAILESSDNGFLVVNQNGQVELTNRKFQEICKIPEYLIQAGDDQKMIDDMITRLVNPDEFINKVKELYDSEDDSFDIIRLKDGTVIERYTTPLSFPNSNMKGRIWTFRDISEKVKMQEMMIQSEKMLSIGGLAAGMAHEINNPLAGMMQTAGNIRSRLSITHKSKKAKALAEEIGVELDAMTRFMKGRDIFRMLDSLSESGVRIAKIVENMLSFARKSENQFEAVSINDLLIQTVDLAATDYDLKKRYDFKLIKTEFELDDNIQPIFCDPQKIQQVILNLLRNAAQAMQDAGTVNPTIRIKTKQSDNYVEIYLKDTGPGMDDETSRRIFEPFFTTKEIGVGTGLGLSVSYFIITENHNGRMNITTSPGMGAEFKIELPITKRLPNK